MNKFLAILLPILFVTTVTANAGGRIQNEDVKSLTDITAAVLTTTGNISSSTTPTCITSPGSTTGLAVGLFIYDTTNPTAIASGTTIAGLPGTCSAGQIQMSASAVSTHTGDTLTFGGQASQLINDTKLWVTSVTPPQQLSKAITTGAIGGTAGTKNYLTTYNGNSGNGNFEFGNTTGWSLGTIGTLTNGLPTGSPTFGSGASGNLSISTVTSGSQIAGTYSLSYASSAATTAGNMLASSAFTIDTEDQAKVMTVKFYYTANSGTANDNWSGTSSNSFAWAAYDVTNSAWLSSTGNFCTVQGTGIGYCTGTLQTGSSTASMRFVFYNANASSGATTIYLDDFFVGPQTAPFGPAVTDGVAYTPTALNFNSVTNNTAYWKRVGEDMVVTGSFACGAAGSAAGAAINVPSPYLINSAKVPTRTASNQYATVGSGASSSIGTFQVNFDTSGGNMANVYLGKTSSVPTGAENASNICTGSGQNVSYFFRVPIVGWSSNTAMSSDTDTRVVAMQVQQASPTATITSSLSLMKITAAPSQDTHGGFSTSTGLYTVPVSGYYRVNAGTQINGTYSINNATSIGISKNGASPLKVGTDVAGGGQGGLAAYVTDTILCSAGDTLAPWVSSQATSPVFAASTLINYFNVERVSGPAVVAATESVFVSAQSTATTSFTTNVFLTPAFNTAIKDTHGAFNTSTGVFTAPVSGSYTACTTATAAPSVAAQLIDLALSIGGSSNIIRVQNVSAGTGVSPAFCFAAPMTAGQTAFMQVRCTFGSGTCALTTGLNQSASFSIWRTGN